ncbi:MAG TPA: GNAT family N-acetyltransferase [Candidatus Desulfovibrio intestinipullorum]|uniref:GNAT family N-acetyltransferase n=1 Tax=Candidatus Desulfovibrio intestinipullorum TaxID=2838536 RepID=A0A9D1TQ47_9BACT|nr:GNAT family N-acetyltransferase [Candidatus Desulfovibrio intestinipullorum]
MSVQIVPVTTPQLLETFVALPWSIYREEDPWVPGLKKDDISLLTPGRHPFWETARRELFLAFRDSRPVGRIAAIVDDKANAYAGERCGAIGFFECQQDKEAAFALFASARDWHREQGMLFQRGPLNPSTNYTCGLLVDGFDVPPGLMMPWNPPYYLDLFNAWHFRKEQDLFAYHIYKDTLHLAPWLDQELKRLKDKGDFTYRQSTKATLAEDVRTMLDIYSESWAKNFCFTPLSERESQALVKELVAYLDSRFFVLFFHEGEPAGGMVALPNFNPLLRRLNGRLGLLAPWHYFRTRRELKEGYRIMLFGIREKFRLLGLPLLLFDFMLTQARASRDFKWVEGSWVLEDNVAVDDLIEDFGGQLCKRYRLFRKDIV